jgi:diguanylate cyclase (GGDEF)-like protein
VPSTGWFVVARLPTAEALVPVQRTKKFIVTHSLITIAIFIIVACTFFFWILRPLRRAAAQAEKMTCGEAPLAALQVVREDEVGHLTAAFNRLLAKLLKSQAEAEYMAHHDPLTGLPNRTLFDDRMKQALARARRNNNRVALLFLDLDGFKTINDMMGHEAGDEALKEVARRFLTVLRETDTLARVGGDEFVLLAADLDEPAENRARTLATKCIDSVSTQLYLRGSLCPIGVSVGIALSDGPSSAESLLAAADKAMYEAKQSGRGCYVLAPYNDDSRTAAD